MRKKNTGTDKISFEAGVGEIPRKLGWLHDWFFWAPILREESDGKAAVARTKIKITQGWCGKIRYDEEEDQLTIPIMTTRMRQMTRTS